MITTIDDPTWIDPQGAIPVIIILWVIVIMMILVSSRRAKIRRGRQARIQADQRRHAAYRESYIQAELDKEEEEIP